VGMKMVMGSARPRRHWLDDRSRLIESGNGVP
jgi:hypothetical protein